MESKQQQLQEGGVSVIQLPSPDSLSTASVKEYAPSFSSEPPPAYHKPRSTAVQVARIAGITLVAASAILGAFLLAAAWVNTRYSCSQQVVVPMHASHTQGHEHLPSFDRLVDPLQASEQKLESTKVVEEVTGNALKTDEENKSTTEETKKEQTFEEPKEEEEEDSVEEEDDEDQNSEDIPIQIRLPLQLDFDELAGMLMERNMRSRMNCIVEKKRAEEFVDHHPRTLQLPFGLNLTTDPRHERVTGERMAIFCESGHDQMQQQQPNRPEMPFEFIPLVPQSQQQAGPIVVPLPGPIHLPFQFTGPMQQHHQQQQPMHQQQQPLHQQPPHFQPPHPQAPHHEEPNLQNPMVHPQQTIHILNPLEQEILQHHMHMQQMQKQQMQDQQMHQQQMQQQEMIRRLILEQEALESMRPPPPPVPSAHQLPPQQVPVHHMPHMGPIPGHQGPIISVHRLVEVSDAKPEEIPNHEGIPSGRAMRGPIPQRLPVHLPLPGNIRGINVQEEEEHRPHYVQPRSVPSDPFTSDLHRRDKRMKKRCACDCSC